MEGGKLFLWLVNPLCVFGVLPFCLFWFVLFSVLVSCTFPSLTVAQNASVSFLVERDWKIERKKAEG